ncbi:GAF and HD-GYP domain-containing protein [Thermodesulfobacteriota bacterium]
MLTEKEKLDTLTVLGIELGQVNDLDILLERVLLEARHFVNADAGSIYIREGDMLNFTYTQNDTLQRRLPDGEKLIYSTFSLPMDTKSIAGYAAATGNALNLPDVYHIDPTTPFGFNTSFDEATGYKTQSMLTIPLKKSTGDVMGVLQIINAKSEDEKVIPFSETDEKTMFHFASVAAVALQRAQMTRAILLRMIRMAEMRDPKETGAHVNRVAGYSIEIYEQWARKRQLPPKEVDKNRDILRMAAMLHDVGKVATSDLILKKPGRLDEEEFQIMKQHTVLGARLFLDRQSDFDEAAGRVALNHHERWEGTGYPGHVDVATGAALAGYTRPDGSPRPKQGEEIPLFGRIVALSDVFDALCSRRSYKEAWDESETLKLIEKESGTHFDPELVEIFFASFKMIQSIQKRYQEAAKSE